MTLSITTFSIMTLSIMTKVQMDRGTDRKMNRETDRNQTDRQMECQKNVKKYRWKNRQDNTWTDQKTIGRIGKERKVRKNVEWTNGPTEIQGVRLNDR